MTGLEKYVELDKKLGEIRSKYPSPEFYDPAEDSILDEMEHVWWKEMTEEEKAAARKLPSPSWPAHWPKPK